MYQHYVCTFSFLSMTEPLGHVEETINRLEAGEARLFSNTPLTNGCFAELPHANFHVLYFLSEAPGLVVISLPHHNLLGLHKLFKDYL